MELNQIYQGDALEVLKTFPSESIDCCITSPPYWGLRDYGVDNQLGLENDFNDYIKKLCDIFGELLRVLKKEGTLWVNIGDTYCAGNVEGFIDATDSERIYKSVGRKKRGGSKEVPRKSLMQIPARFVLEMLNRGWINRNEIIWYKPACMPTSAEDRFTIDFEKIFFFVKSERYYFEQQFDKSIWFDKDKRAITGGITKSGKSVTPEGQQYAISKSGSFREDGMRNKRCVWKINTKPSHDPHFAAYPEELCATPIKAGCPEGGTVLDPFMGSGTTALVAKKLKRNYIGIELNPEYIKIAEQRLRIPDPMF